MAEYVFQCYADQMFCIKQLVCYINNLNVLNQV